MQIHLNLNTENNYRSSSLLFCLPYAVITLGFVIGLFLSNFLNEQLGGCYISTRSCDQLYTEQQIQIILCIAIYLHLTFFRGYKKKPSVWCPCKKMRTEGGMVVEVHKSSLLPLTS